MKNITLVYLPFCTPACPPYSITNLYAFLKNNCSDSVKASVLDLNIFFHKIKYPEYQKYFQNSEKWQEYEYKSSEYMKLDKETCSKNNKRVVEGKTPELFNDLLTKITNTKPNIVLFSIVYASQAFYASALIKELKKQNIKCIIGGPCVNEKLKAVADASLNEEKEILEYIGENISKLNLDYSLDFSIYDLKEYFTPKIVIPIKTSSSCLYKQCTFCSHYNDLPYQEFSIEKIKKTIIASKQKNFFFIDDMIHSKRLLKIAEALKPLNINWTCQLKPTVDFDYNTLKTLRESGMTMAIWGVESGSQRILDLINKGTNKDDVANVLADARKAGIKNVIYIMFGFPSETESEFIETIDFLKSNNENIDLISVSLFGLQRGTAVYQNPDKFFISKIIEEERTVLQPRISYELSQGLNQEHVKKLIKKNRKTIESINKYPALMNYFREHMLCLIE